MKFLIVTNSFQRPLDLVIKSLSSSLSQDPQPEKVILIDQNQPSLNLPLEISQHPRFVHQKVTAKAVSQARNQLQIPPGIDWLIFCDDDGYLAKDYTKDFFRIISAQPQLEILAGGIRRTDNGEFYSLRHKIGGSLKNFRHTKLLMGSNFCVKANTFDQLGRFDEDFGAGAHWGSGEETDFCWKAYFAAVPMDYFSELIVFHIPPFNESFQLGFKKAYIYGVGKGALVSKWLFQKKKAIVFFELIEMLIVPLIQICLGILTLKWGLAINNFGILGGRVVGVIKFLSKLD
jgi:hypothetical protein